MESGRMLVSGAGGLIGSAVCAHFRAQGWSITKLTRRSEQCANDEIYWQPSGGVIDGRALNNFDVVVHLAGENIASGRWTKKKKQRIWDSRIRGTKLLCELLAQQPSPPKLVITASAVGYYGDTGARLVDESSAAGTNFLADVCKHWEISTAACEQAKIRVVKMRLGVVLSQRGGVYARLRPLFGAGLGGVVGSGDQYMSWITLADVVRFVEKAIESSAIHGPVNLVAPQPVTNREWTKSLGKVLRRPTIFPLPRFAVKLLMGEMGSLLLLASSRVDPQKLREYSFEYRYTDLEKAFEALLECRKQQRGERS